MLVPPDSLIGWFVFPYFITNCRIIYFVSLINKHTKMKNHFLFIALIIVALTACNTTNTKIKEHISGSDSVEINNIRGE